jgi:hypothetical protein
VEKYGTAGQATDHNTIRYSRTGHRSQYNTVQPDRPQIWRTRIACWITKATDTHPEYVIIVDIRRERNSALTFVRTMPVFLNAKPDGATIISRL